MGLFIKIQKGYEGNLNYNRFKAAIKIFHHLKNVFHPYETFSYLFHGDSTDDSFGRQEYSFGLLETYFRKALQDKDRTPKEVGLIIEGKFKAKEKVFSFLFELKPREFSNKDRYDIFLEILPNKQAEVFEDVVKYIPDFNNKLTLEIKKYNTTIPKKEYLIRRAVMSLYGEEYGNIKSWSYLYSLDEDYFVSKIIDSNEELRNRLSFGNRGKFIHRILNNDDFAFLLSNYSNYFNVGVAGNSIIINPSNLENMNNFISQLSTDLNRVAKRVYKKEEETEKLIDEQISSLVE
jgi:hypothetical protein